MDATTVNSIAKTIFEIVTACLFLFFGTVYFYKKLKDKKEGGFVVTEKTLKTHEFFVRIQDTLVNVSTTPHFRESESVDKLKEDVFRDFMIIMMRELRDAMEELVKTDIAIEGDGGEWHLAISSIMGRSLAACKTQIRSSKIPTSFAKKWNAKIQNHSTQLSSLLVSLSACPVHATNGARTCTLLTFVASLLPIMTSLGIGILRAATPQIKDDLIGYNRKIFYNND